MISSFFGLNIASRGLFAQQRAMDVIGHNIANANTKGYSRQESVYTAGSPFMMPGMNRLNTALQLGTGVVTERIRRVRDTFLDWQVRNQIWQKGEWESKKDALTQMEGVLLDESSEYGISGSLVRYWDAWQELTLQPESRSVREHLLSRSSLLLSNMKGLSDRLFRMQVSEDEKVVSLVGRINDLSGQIAGLNKEISMAVAVGYEPNDLFDRRDLMIDELSTLADLNIQEGTLGQVNVLLGGKQLVREDTSVALMAVPEQVATGLDGNTLLNQVLWSDDARVVDVNSGKLYGVLYSRDVMLKDFHDKLNDIAMTLAAEVNSQHQQGFGLDGSTGLDFFVGTSVRDLEVNPDLINDPNQIAAALDDPTGVNSGPGDGGNAVLMAQLRYSRSHPATNLDGATYEDYYQSLLARTGVDAQQAVEMSENMDYLAGQFEQRRQEVSGVSLDEEMVNMVKFQHAYNAAARMVTTVDEMLDRIVNTMGLVGR